MFETSPNGVIMQGLYGQILDCNDRFLDILKVSEKEIIGKSFIDICQMDEENGKKYLDNFQDMVNGDEIEPFEINITNTNGNTIWLEIYSGLIKKDDVVVAAQSIVHEITEKKKIEKERIYQIEFEQLISDISTHLIEVPIFQLDKAIKDSLKSIGKFIGIDRSYIFVIDFEKMIVTNTHEWCAEGIESQINNLKNLDMKSLKWSRQKIIKSGGIYISNVDDLPVEANEEKKIFQKQKIKSIVTIPMVHAGNHIGYVGLDSVKKEKIWTEQEIILLKIIGKIFTNALNRKWAHKELQKSEKKYKSLFDQAANSILLIDLESGEIIDFNEKCCENLGYSHEEFKKLRISDFEIIEFPEEIKAHLKKIKKEGFDIFETKHRTKDGEIKNVLVSCKVIDINGKKIHQVIMHDITDRKKAEEMLTYRVKFEKLIRAISTSFINLFSTGIDNGIEEALKHMGEFMDVDRSYVFQLSNDGKKIEYTHEWCAEAIEPQIDKVQEFILDKDLPLFAKKIRNLEINQVPDVEKLSPSAEKENLQRQGIKSLIIVPMISHGCLMGFIGFDSVRHKKTWSEDAINLLKIIGGIFINALEYKKSEELLKQSEEKYRTIIESMNDGVIIHKDGKLLYANHILFDMAGEDITGKDFIDFVAPEDQEKVIENYMRRVKGEEVPENYEIGIVFGENRLDVEISISMIEYLGKSATQVILHDITERKEAEKALLESEERYRGIITYSPDVIFSLSVDDGTITSLNPAFEKITGWSNDDWIGKSFAEIIHPDDFHIAINSFQETFSNKEIKKPFELRILTKTGEYINAEFTIKSQIENGEIVNIFGFARDVTQRKKVEEKIIQHNEILKLINKTLRHDVLNDLTVVSGSLDLYNENKDEKYITNATKSLKRSIDLIKRMKELENIVSKSGTFKPFDVREIIENVLKSYQIEYSIYGDSSVLADDAFKSVIDNIVWNSILHSKTDKINVKIGNCGGKCEIKISDYGIGIPDKIKERVFDEGFKYGETAHSGLGLYIVKKIIERYNGEILVEDNKPKGSTFIIKLKTCK